MYQIKRKLRAGLLLALPTVLAVPQSPVRNVSNAFDVFDYIDPFIGTINGGAEILNPSLQ